MNRNAPTSPLVATVLLLLLLLLLTASSAASRPLRAPPGPAVWRTLQGLRGRTGETTTALAARSRRLGQRVPAKSPPSPNPNGMKTMVAPAPPPPAY